MKRAYLDRLKDISGISGTGKIAEVAVSSDGRVAVFWPEPFPSVAVFSNNKAMLGAHGHNGRTKLVYLDDPSWDMGHCEACHIQEVQCMQHGNDTCPGCLAGVS